MERETPEMLKPFAKKSNKNYVHGYLVKSNSLI